MAEESIFRQLLSNSFDTSKLDYESLVSLGQEIVDSKKISHRLLGRLAIALEKIKKKDTLKAFSKEIGISYSGMRGYKSVEERLGIFELPDDLSWGSMLALSQQEDPGSALKHILKEGFSNAEIISLYGKKQPHGEKVCPKCGTTLSQ